MSKQVIDHRDPVALFNRLVQPIAEQLHTANIALLGWLYREMDVAYSELPTKISRLVEFRPMMHSGKGIGVIMTSGRVGRDNGIGLIFEPRTEFDVVTEEGKTLTEENAKTLLEWLTERYPTACVLQHERCVSVRFDLFKYQIAAF